MQLLQTLTARGLLSDSDRTRAAHAVITPDVLAAMPLRLVHRKNLMPVARNNGTLVVATGDPFDAYALDELQTLTGLHVMPVLAPPREIARLIKAHFGVGGDTIAALAEAREEEEVELLEDIEAD